MIKCALRQTVKTFAAGQFLIQRGFLFLCSARAVFPGTERFRQRFHGSRILPGVILPGVILGAVERVRGGNAHFHWIEILRHVCLWDIPVIIGILSLS